MALTPNERRRLREIEQQLAREDPAFAASVGGREPSRSGPANRLLRWLPLAALAAVALSIVVAIVAGIAYGAVLMLFMLAASAFVSLGIRARSSPDQGPWDGGRGA